jgi:putative hydrolase of the HAD superfamily
MSGKVKAIFFDAGNTLLYPCLEKIAADLAGQGFTASVDDFHAAERAGKRKLEEWLWPQIRARQVLPGTDRYYWNAYYDKFVERMEVPAEARTRLVERMRESFRDIQNWSYMFPETADVLGALSKREYRLGVISNSVGTVEAQLNRAGIGRHFEFVLDSFLVGVEKPNPEIFEMALERANVEPSAAVLVGDTYATDIGGAQLAGLRGILLDRVGAYPEATCPRITSLSELKARME